MQSFFNLFFLGVNVTFFPIHFIGLQGCPRKYKRFAERYLALSSLSSVGAVVSTFSIWWFCSVIRERLISYRLLNTYPIIISSIERSLEGTSHTFIRGYSIIK
jgi:heme/copper-type cytochrome/quinol oxidase subunit 1